MLESINEVVIITVKTVDVDRDLFHLCADERTDDDNLMDGLLSE